MFEADYTKGRIRQWFDNGQLEYEYFIKDGAEHGDMVTENFYYPQAGTNFLCGLTMKF